LLLVRTESLGRVVQSIRQDIQALWDEAGIESDAQRQEEFAEFYTPIDRLQDSAVDVHEAYYSVIRARVEELRPLLSEITRRETVVQERIELEHIQMNPERLSARGPHAREERKKEEGMNSRVKNLEKITKKVLTLIANWEEHNGPFFYAGERYADRVEEQESNYQEIRASLRNSRKRKDEKSDKGGRVPVKRPSSSSAAPAGASKSSGYGQSASSGYGQAAANRSINNKENGAANERSSEGSTGDGSSDLRKLIMSDRLSAGTDVSGETEVREHRASSATAIRQ